MDPIIFQSQVLKEHFQGFHHDFTDIQKKAILISLFDIANSDNELHRMELKFFHEISLLLGYSMDDNTIYQYLEMDRKYITKILAGLNEKQKSWFVVTVLGMMYSDGKIHPKEAEFVEEYLKDIGVSHELFEESKIKGRYLMAS